MTDVVEKETAVWRQYPDYPFIEANQFGEIRTVDRYVPSKNGSRRLVKGRVLKQRPNNGGYMYVSISMGNKKNTSSRPSYCPCLFRP